MNNLDLRQAIIQRVQNKSGIELTEVIEDSIGNDERTLPGLGVLFEIIWQHSSGPDQNKMVNALHSHLQGGESAPPSPS
ncbi:small acid-soluble spore protein SspI [Paenibacillus mendelii]|uniref:Small, acid-soluble spore protein I n=1 Tax=Paenibacillus mendelii TaxID=206163 RepID=A0ABV6JK10_9BACL|nr:small acid-soluble spore protein SspI [Paenibacillus mendelii]MCQ6559189.1 small acid-soluble spore protein SspI [Paenibacillus mendelii]